MLRFSAIALLASRDLACAATVQARQTGRGHVQDASRRPMLRCFKRRKRWKRAPSRTGLTAGLPAARRGPRLTPRNLIDEQIFGKMQRDGIPHAPLATDQEFLRRVMLDLTGRIPTPAEVREFLADNAADKRARLIDSSSAAPALWTSGRTSISTWCAPTAKCSAASSFSIGWSRTASRPIVLMMILPAT